jgi:hypothetical protein
LFEYYDSSILGGDFMKRKKSCGDDIKVVVMNPECIPIAQERMFEFFYERFMREQQVKEEHNELKDAK